MPENGIEKFVKRFTEGVAEYKKSNIAEAIAKWQGCIAAIKIAKPKHPDIRGLLFRCHSNIAACYLSCGLREIAEASVIMPEEWERIEKKQEGALVKCADFCLPTTTCENIAAEEVNPEIEDPEV